MYVVMLILFSAIHGQLEQRLKQKVCTVIIQYFLIQISHKELCIATCNSMISNGIGKKHAQVSFSNISKDECI